MAHEIETKVLDIDSAKVQKQLTELGATKLRETRLIVDWYRPVGTKEGEDAWYLRIRSNSEGEHEVTWKAKSEISGTTRKHKEINFHVDEPEKLSDLFEGIGLEKYARQEKDRISFTLQDWLFEIDDYPGMPPFLEIEGSSEEHVNEAIKLLGLEKNRTWAEGERTLIQKVYGLDWYHMQFE
ncbi:MAG: CYTH domain-containing protein [Patescibacteria group bacterium]